MNRVDGSRDCRYGRQGRTEAAGCACRARMSVMRIAMVMAVMAAVSHHATMHMMMS
ncbi:hypothetical protein [Paraburkholderia fungorum]|uniref:hypothetical protein n=1 Tax=Paraburkholderia fungorum TaxID=134537 RepID=UPI00130E2A16|nr:hypothetical protein [Paraburkholderia fungorum]